MIIQLLSKGGEEYLLENQNKRFTLSGLVSLNSYAVNVNACKKEEAKRRIFLGVTMGCDVQECPNVIIMSKCGGSSVEGIMIFVRVIVIFCRSIA